MYVFIFNLTSDLTLSRTCTTNDTEVLWGHNLTPCQNVGLY